MKETRFKQTEIGLIPEDWEISYIENECKVETGSKNTQDKKDNGKYPFYVRSEKIERINTYSYDCEAVLTAGDGVGTGKVFHYINGKFEVHQRVYIINEFSDKLNGLFFYLYFSNNFLGRIKSMTAKSSVDSVRKDMINKMQIPLPLLHEQKKIASALTSIDNLLLSLDKLIEKKRLIKQGAMQELLTGKKRLPGFAGEWVEKRIGEILSIGNGKDYKLLKKGRVPVYGTGGILSYVDKWLYEGKTVCIGRKGTIDKPIYCNGKIWTVDTLFYTYNFNGACPLYVYYLFCSIDWKAYNEATGVPSLSKNTIENIDVVVPEFEEQCVIANLLSEIDEEIKYFESKKAKYEQIKQGMMQQLLTGKIRLI